MDYVELLEQVRREEDPAKQWKLLEQAGQPPELPGEVQAARLWWQARYAFTDRKQTLVKDKFVWLLVTARGWNDAVRRAAKTAPKEYCQVMASPELEAAVTASDRLAEELRDAVCIYAETLREERAILGILRPGRRSKDSQHLRIAGEIVGPIMVPLARWCAPEPHLKELLRALFLGTKQCYPDIQPALLTLIEEIQEDALRGLITDSVRDTSLGDF